MDFTKRGGWKIFMKSINVEGGFCFCGGWNFSKLVSVDSTFIREMRVNARKFTRFILGLSDVTKKNPVLSEPI